MKDTRETCEQEIKKLLKEDPQAAIILAMEQYTGLIWTVSGRYLANPEDRKECVNDTFAELYWKRERFDETKGSLAAFLSGIARHHAISHYRKNKRYKADELHKELPEQGEEIEWVDSRLDLEAALDNLKAEDAEIIRMKYYGGMTVREIADSLDLPYETVKKRHQRSLGKLRLLLLIALILLLAVGLVACVHFVLKHFGVIPGYGINQSEEMPFYILDDTSVFENEQLYVKLESGVMSEDSLILKLRVELREAQDLDLSGLVLIMEDGIVYSESKMITESPLDIEQQDWNRKQIEITFEPVVELTEKKEIIPMTLCISEIELPFTFCKANEKTLEDYSYVLDSQGGVLAIPQLKDGRLYVDLYPLNCGDYITAPGFIRNIYEGVGGPKGEVTVTGKDGIVQVGECLLYNPFSSNSFYRWDFGPAEEGEYILNIPYVYQTAMLPEDFKFTVSDAQPGIGQRFSIPGSLLTISEYSKEQPDGTDFATDGEQEDEKLRRFLCFDVETEDADRVLVGMELMLQVDTEDDGNIHYFSSSLLWRQQEGYVSYLGYTVQLPKGYETGLWVISGTKRDSVVTYRWNHSFSVPIHVEEEN